ncbi:Retrovirus-related Pol polyprotein from transposon RE1 [Bienertia sinuspersici]
MSTGSSTAAPAPSSATAPVYSSPAIPPGFTRPITAPIGSPLPPHTDPSPSPAHLPPVTRHLFQEARPTLGPSFGGSTFVMLQSTYSNPGSSNASPMLHPINPLSSDLSSIHVNTLFTLNIKNYVTTVLQHVEDYLPWRTQFESFLVSHGLLGMIDGTLPMPSPFLSNNTGRDHINPDYYLWLKIDQFVRSWLFATLHRDILVEVHDVKFSTLIWERLQSRFMSASLARSMELKHTLSFIQKSESQSMDQYLRDIKVLVDSFAAINSPISLPDLIQYTLNGLGPDYDSLVTTILHFSGHLTFDELRSKLLVQERRIHALQAGSSSSQH